MSHAEKATIRVTAAIQAGLILHANAPVLRCDCTVGPNQCAVEGGPGYAVIYIGGPRGIGLVERTSAWGAARDFVSAVGSTRAREAAIAAERKARTA